MDTPVIDLTAAPDSPRRRNESAASSSSQEAPLVATSLTAARTAHSHDSRTVNAVAGGSGPSTRLSVLPARRRVPYPTNAASTPIDLTDDDIEYLGEHRLHLPDQPHVEGNDARPVAGDNYSLMDRLRNAAGMPFSRHASSSSSTTNNTRVIDEDPLRFGVATAGAGPGPAAVAAANARARRNANANATNNNDNNPPAGLNARRNRQRVQNAHNANNHINNGAGGDPAPYYYRRVQPPPPPAPARRAARAGRRQRDVYQGLLHGAGGAAGYDDGWEGEVQDEVYRYLGGNGGDDGGGGDFDDFADIEFQPYLGVGRNNNNNAGRGALQGIMQLLGFGNHLMNNNNHNALPINHQHIHFNHANPPKRKVKAYSVRQSHPNFNKKKDGKDGFERDIIPPPEIDEEEEEAEHEQPEVDEAAKQKSVPEEKVQEASQEAKEDSIMEIQPEEESGSASTRSSSRNKGKGRALEIDTSATSTGQEMNADIPILDLANGSPNTSASTASSALFSGKLSNSTRATSADGNTDSDSAKQTETQTQVTTAAPTQPIKPKTRTIRAPVCTSCSTPLFLNQSSKGRPYVLLCGHVICRGCLDAATERLRRFTMDEPEVIQDDEDEEGGDIAVPTAKMYEDEDDEDDGNSSLPPLPSKRTAWKGARLKESFEEVDRSRSSTIAETSTGRTSTSKSARDKKGKKKAINVKSNATASTSASTSQAPAASTSTSTTTRSSGRGTRRNATRPDYAELDGDEEGQPDGSYVPRSARDGQADDESEDVVSRIAGHQASTEEEDDEESTLRSLIRKKPDNATAAASARITKSKKGPTAETQEDDEMANEAGGAEDPDYVTDRKGKGRIKIVMNGVSTKQENAAEGPSSSNTHATTVAGKRKRGKEDNEAAASSSGKSTSAKAKKPKIEKPPLIDVHWLTCPVNGCKGGTDLSKAIGSREGAWELFV